MDNCRVLQCVAVCCSVEGMHDTSHEWIHGHVGWSVAVCCSVLQCVAVCCSVLQCVAVLSGYMAPLMSEYMDTLGG